MDICVLCFIVLYPLSLLSFRYVVYSPPPHRAGRTTFTDKACILIKHP